MTLIDERITNLPKWAHQHIKNLMQKVDGLKAELAEERSTEPTGIEVDPYNDLLDRPRKFLQDDSRVRFMLGDCRRSEFIDVQLRDGVLIINGGDSVDILPDCSNLFRIKMRKD
jgi:hypothetical protein